MCFLLQLLSRSLRKTSVPETFFINCHIFTSWYIPCPSGAQSSNSFLFVSCRLAVGHTLCYKRAFSRNDCEVTITREGRWLAKKRWTGGHTITSVCNETRFSRLHGRGWNGWDIRTSFPFFWVLWPPRTQPCITVWKTQRGGFSVSPDTHLPARTQAVLRAQDQWQIQGDWAGASPWVNKFLQLPVPGCPQGHFWLCCFWVWWAHALHNL